MSYAAMFLGGLLVLCAAFSLLFLGLAAALVWANGRLAERRQRNAAKALLVHRPAQIPAAPLPMRPLPHIAAALDRFGDEYAELLNARHAATGPSQDDVYAVLDAARGICRDAAHTDI